MEHDEIAARVLECLRAEDLEVLLNLNFRRAFSRGDVIVASGEQVDRFYLVEAGLLRMEGEPGRDPRFLRAGQVFGSTSLILRRPSPNNVIALEDGILLTLSRDELDWLMEAQPVVAVHLLRALSAGLAGRSVRDPVGAGAFPDVEAPRPRSAGLTQVVEACRQAEVDLGFLGQAPEEGAARWARERIPKVAGIYRPVLRAVAALLDHAPPGERAELVQQARDEFLGLVRTSRLVERMQRRPTGQSAGYRFFNHIYRNVPEGDDTVGLLTDAWLLTRPFAEAIRERRAIASERLAQEVRDRARPDRIFRILSLGCGPARSLADVLEEPGMADKISITCVDDDQEALVHANNLLRSRAPRGDILFRQSAPARLTPDTEGYGSYDLVASLYTADNADVAALGRILFLAHRWLHAHASVQLVVFGDAVPDWLLLEVALDWSPLHPGQRELEEVAVRSPFGQSRTTVSASPSGLNVFLHAVK